MGISRSSLALDLTAQAVIAAYQDTASRYDGYYQDPVALAEDALVRQWLLPYRARLAPDELVVDLGCGTGAALDLLAPLRPSQYLGLDLSPDMLAVARARHPGYQLLLGDLRDPLTFRLVGERRVGLIVALFGSASYHLTPFATLTRQAMTLPIGGTLCAILFGPGYVRRAPEPPPYLASWTHVAAWEASLDHLRFRSEVRALSPRWLVRALEAYGARPGADAAALLALRLARSLRPRDPAASFITLSLERVAW